MTVTESIIAWLKTFDRKEYRKLKRIDTDRQSAEVDSFALIKEPIVNTRTFLSGRKLVTGHYTVLARLANSENTDRIFNNAFGEELEGWVHLQNERKSFPQLEGATVQRISITTPFYVGVTEENSSIYQMTIAIEYLTNS